MKRTISEASILDLTEPEDDPIVPPTLPIRRARVLPASFSSGLPSSVSPPPDSIMDDSDDLYCLESAMTPPPEFNRLFTPLSDVGDVQEPAPPPPPTPSVGLPFFANVGKSFRHVFWTLNASRRTKVFDVDTIPEGAVCHEGFDNFVDRCNDVFTGWTMQLERGKEGRLHLQGVGVSKQKTTLKVYKERLGEPSIHLEPVKDLDAAWQYCNKDDTRYGCITYCIYVNMLFFLFLCMYIICDMTIQGGRPLERR